MKMFIPLKIFSVVSIVVLFTATVRAETIRIATTEYPPVTAEKSDHGGFVNRVIQEALSRQGYDVSFKYLPWKRALETGKKCKYDGVSFSFENAERAQDFAFSAVLSEHREVFFLNKSTQQPKWNALADLKGYKIGATRGYTYTEEFWQATEAKTLDIHLTSSDEQNFKKLGAKRIDLFPMDEITGWNLVNASLPVLKDALTTAEKPLRTTTGHLIFSKSCKMHPQHLEAFNAGLQTMKNDGTYNRFLDELFAGKF